MATWFIRLGSDKYKEDKYMYQALAEKHNLIMIGYGIEYDITNESRTGIVNYFREKEGSGKSPSRRASLVHSFINVIEIGDIVICPFDGGYIRISEVKSQCQTVKSFFKDSNKLKDFLKKHPGEGENDPKIKPAIKVKWLSDKLSMNDLPDELRNALKLRPTVNNLHLEGVIDPSSPKAYLKFALTSLIKTKKTEAEAEDEAKKVKEGKKYDFMKTLGTVLLTTILTASITGIINAYFNSCLRDLECEAWSSILGIFEYIPMLILLLIVVAFVEWHRREFVLYIMLDDERTEEY